MNPGRKKIFIGLSVMLVVLVAAFFWMSSRNRTLSPAGSAEGENGDLKVQVDYSRPSVRGRTIFGPDDQSPLLPYGKYWRLGANEPTAITFSRDVKFNGSPVPAGKYRIYAFPGPETFEVVLNSEIGFWGAQEPDYTRDILRTKVPVAKPAAPAEQFTMAVEKAATGVTLVIRFADVELSVPVE